MNHRFRKFLAGVLAVTMLASLLPAAFAAEGDTTLTIIATSDTHANVWGWSYEDGKESTAGSLAQISTYVKGLRDAGENVILVDNGDTIQGTIMSDDLANKRPDDAHPVIAAMNYMGYDAMGLGNHEFNWGLTNMKKILGQAQFPVLCSNIKDAKGEFVTADGAWTMVERAGVKVAIISADTPNIKKWDGGKDGIDDLQISSMVEGVQAAIKDIDGKADLIMVVAHAGPTAEYGGDDAQAILAACPEVDILQCGHSHTSYINNDGPVPVGEVKNGAGEVLKYTVVVDKDKKVTSATVETVSVKEQAPDEGLRAVEAVKAVHEEAVEYISGNVLGHATAKFQPENEIKGIPQGKLEDTAVMDLINAVQLEYAQADVSAAALFKDTSDLPEGELNYGNIFDIYKYDNTLCRVKITGAQLKEYMEWSASHYNTWTPGDINISFNKAIPGYRYDMFAGVDYEINLSKPAGERIENVMYKGEPLKDDQELKLAVNNYRFSSAVKAMVGGDEAKEWESSQSIRDMLVEYLAEHDPLDPADYLDNNWRITGVVLQEGLAARAAYIEKINYTGELATPYYKSINLNEANNVIVDGTLNSADSVDDDNTPNGEAFYFRLRDMATILKGTDAAFNVGWDGKVTITKGGEYTDEALAPVGANSATPVSLTVAVDGTDVTVDALLVIEEGNEGGNYYVTAQGLNAILGTNAAMGTTPTDKGVMILSAKNTAASGQGG